jgi:hypothetical protein
MYHNEAKQCEEATALRIGGLSKCAQLNNTMEMEVEASLVGDCSCSKEVFKGGSTQGQREKEIQRTYAKPRSRKGIWEARKKGLT